MDQNRNIKEIITYDNNGNLDAVYIIDPENYNIVIEKQKYSFLFKDKRTGKGISSIDSRTFYSYNSNNCINRVLYNQEQSDKTYILFIDAKVLLDDKNIKLRFWRFQPTISKKAFIEKEIIIEKKYSSEKDHFYRVVFSYEYDPYYKGKKIYEKKKFIYERKKPEQLKEIIVYSVNYKFHLINKLIVPFLNFLIFFLNQVINNTKLEIPIIKGLIVLAKRKNKITSYLPNELIKSSIPISNMKIFSWLRDEYIIHSSVLKENTFEEIQSSLDEVVNNNKSL